MASIYKRGNVYWGKIQRKNRVFRQSLKTKSKSEAERRLRQWETDLEAIAWGDMPQLSFDKAVLSFIDEYLPTLKPQSARRYATSIKNLIPSFESMYLHKIGSKELSDFETRRRHEGVKPPTIIRDLACLSSIFSFAEDREWIEGNPVKLFLRRRAKRGLKNAPPRTRYLTKEDEHALLHEAKGTLRDAVALSIDTGLRCEELLSLKWDQVDLRNQTVSTTKDTKTGTVRTVPLLSRSIQILERMPRDIRSQYVLCHGDGARFTTFRKGFGTAIRKAGLSDIRWHDLRRTCGCRLLQDHKMQMHQVSMWLGHSSIKTTETTYAFLQIDNLKQAVTKTGTGHAD